MKSLILMLAGFFLADPAMADDPIHASVEKAIPLLLKAASGYTEKRDCFSCHHQAVPVLALDAAKRRGFDIPADAIDEQVELTHEDLRGAIESYKKGDGQGGGVTRAGYALFTLDVAGKKSDEVNGAVVGYLLKRDEGRDHWKGASNRPPSEASDFTSTYLAIRALTAYGKPADKDRIAGRLEKARAWLEMAEPKDTEDRVFRLFAMKAASSPEASIRKATEGLLATQKDDGGWSQLDGGKSDPYATGSALVALNRAGDVKTDSPAYRKGLGFLIGQQREDGSWFVASRSKPFQPYFESGFPYGKDQFISMAASAWAVTALTLALPER